MLAKDIIRPMGILKGENEINFVTVLRKITIKCGNIYSYKLRGNLNS